MKNLICCFASLGLFFSHYLSAQTAELSVTNPSIVGDTYTFTLVITAIGGDIYLGNSDFIFNFNSSAFDAPSISIVSGGDFGTESGSDSDAATTQDNYFFNTETSIIGSRINVNLSGPNPGSQTAFERRVAKIPSGSSVVFGTFEISGYQSDQEIDLQWNSDTKLFTILSDSRNEVRIGTTLIVPDAALPVELVLFTAEKIDNKEVKLEWITASEVANKGFEIQHSPDGENWQVLDFVAGYGTTSQSREYQFLHSGVPYVENYYRLKQIDQDGAFEFSDIRVVSLSETATNTAFTVYPNPSTDTVNIYLQKAATGATFQLFDATGRLIDTWILDGQTALYTIDLGHLPKGVYSISTKADGRQYREKVILQ